MIVFIIRTSVARLVLKGKETIITLRNYCIHSNSSSHNLTCSAALTLSLTLALKLCIMLLIERIIIIEEIWVLSLGAAVIAELSFVLFTSKRLSLHLVWVIMALTSVFEFTVV